MFIFQLKQNSAVVSDRTPDLYHFHINTFGKLLSHHGVGAAQSADGINIISRTINMVR